MTQDMNHNDMKRNMRNMTIHSNSRLMCSLLLLAMTTLGVMEAWGQTDYSGTYYIASGGKGEKNGSGTSYTYDSNSPSNNFYFCPTEEWCYYKPKDDFSAEGSTYPNPFLTTYKCRSNDYHSGDASDAIWIIEKAPNSDYYYIIQKSTGNHLVSSGQIRTTTNPDRIRVHLEKITDLTAKGDSVLFEISSLPSSGTSPGIEISPKGITDGTSTAHADHDKHRWLTVNYGNYNYLTGRAGKDGGPTGYKDVSGIVCIYSKGDANGVFYLENAKCKTPAITFSDGEVTISSETPGVTIHYTTADGLTDPADPDETATDNIYDPESKPTISATTTFKAVAVKNQMVTSEAVTITIVMNPTINLTIPEEGYTYDGNAKTPAVSVEVSGTTIAGSNYDVAYSNNTAAGTEATITISDKPGGNFYGIVGTTTFTINPAPLSITAKNKTITYGDEPTNDGVVYSGFVGGEDENDLGGELTYAYNYSRYDNAGNYTITPSGLTSTNYSIAFNTGTLTVDPKEVGLEWGTTTFSYDGTPHSPTVTVTGLVNGDDIDITFSGEETNAGSYTATVTGLTGEKAGNYALPAANTQAFTISPKSIGDGNRPASGIRITMEKDGDDYVVTVIDEEINEDTPLAEGEDEDYTISTEAENGGDIVTITGQNNYTGSAKAVYANAVFYRQEETVPFAAVYNSKVDAMPPQAVTVYVVKKVNASIGTVTITPVSYIPADVPVVLEAETNLSGFAASPIDESVVPVSDAIVSSNLLKVAPSGGVPVELTEAYMFYLGEFVLTQKGTIAEGKFFLYNPNYKSRGGASARSLRIVKEEDDTMGIENIQMTKGNKPSNGIWHTLDGRRLNGRPVQKGLYIVNGKKVKI